MCEKYYICNAATCSCENGKYLASTVDDLMSTCDRIIEERKTISTKFKEKKQRVNHKISIFNLNFC